MKKNLIIIIVVSTIMILVYFVGIEAIFPLCKKIVHLLKEWFIFLLTLGIDILYIVNDLEKKMWEYLFYFNELFDKNFLVAFDVECPIWAKGVVFVIVTIVRLIRRYTIEILFFYHWIAQSIEDYVKTKNNG